MVRLMIATALLVVPMAAMAQNGTGVTGQQTTQPSPNQNQSQQQTDNSQQPPNARTLPPSASSQTQPNPLPQLSR